jgi:hypothetical protein
VQAYKTVCGIDLTFRQVMLIGMAHDEYKSGRPIISSKATPYYLLERAGLMYRVDKHEYVFTNEGWDVVYDGKM